MAGFKNAKDLVRDYYAQIDADPLKASKYCAPNALWRGYHPFNEISDPNEVAERFWVPLKQSLKKCKDAWIFLWPVRISKRLEEFGSLQWAI